LTTLCPPSLPNPNYPIMSLNVGDVAPDFTLYSDEKEAWTLSEHRGKNVVLLFFPAAFSGTCTTELNTINNDLARFNSANATVVGISTDSPFSLAEFKSVNALNFPLLSDHEAETATLYSAKHNHDFSAMGFNRIAKRSVFVIDEEGTVIHREVLDNPGNEPDYEAITGALEAA